MVRLHLAPPVDPTNQTSSNLFYTYQTNGTQFETTAVMESQKYKFLPLTDGGPYSDLYVKGSNLNLALQDYAGSYTLGPQLVDCGTFGTLSCAQYWEQWFNNVSPSWQTSTIGGVSDVLKVAITGAYNDEGEANIYTGNGSTSYTLSYSYYIPSSNPIYTNLVATEAAACWSSFCYIGTPNTATNIWTTVTVSNWVPPNGDNSIYFNGTDSGGGEWQTPSGDVYYINNISLKQSTWNP